MKTIMVEIPETQAITEELSRDSVCEIVEKILIVLRNRPSDAKYDLVVKEQGGDLYLRFECVLEELKLLVCRPKMN